MPSSCGREERRLREKEIQSVRSSVDDSAIGFGIEVGGLTDWLTDCPGELLQSVEQQSYSDRCTIGCHGLWIRMKNSWISRMFFVASQTSGTVHLQSVAQVQYKNSATSCSIISIFSPHSTIFTSCANEYVHSCTSSIHPDRTAPRNHFSYSARVSPMGRQAFLCPLCHPST